MVNELRIGIRLRPRNAARILRVLARLPLPETWRCALVTWTLRRIKIQTRIPGGVWRNSGSLG